jgi:import inner membrane translocase subunit TIM8
LVYKVSSRTARATQRNPVSGNKKTNKQTNKKKQNHEVGLTLTMTELGEADGAELELLVATEQQKVQFTAQVRYFMELCWDKCVEKPGSRLDSRTENCCLSSCVDHFIAIYSLLSPVGLPRSYRKEGSRPDLRMTEDQKRVT